MILTAEPTPLESTRGIIYAIICKASWRTYIGKTERTFYDRYPGGKWWQTTTNRFLKADYKRYGKEGFWINVIAIENDPGELTKLESYYIGYFESMYPHGYNLTLDLTMLDDPNEAQVWYAGIVGKRCGMKDVDELISKQDLSVHMAAIRTPEQLERTRHAVSRAQKGKTISASQRAAVSKRHKGIPLDAAHVLKIKQSNTVGQGVPIQRYTLDGVLIDEYPSINEAARQLSINRQAIGNAVRGISTRSGGFKWKAKI